ncbi:TPA: hypothetical protein ACH3X3_006926 [Trebouxia sp. C0006]
MSDSDSGSAGSVAHAPKARKGQDGQVAKLRDRRSARVASASQLHKSGKRCRSSAQPSSGEAPAASPAADPSAQPPTGLPADPSAGPPTGLPADTLADLVARIGTLEQNQADSQQLRSDLLQTQTELAATRTELLKAQSDLTAACSDLAGFKGSVNKRLGEQTSHSIARETAVKDGLRQQVNAEGSSLEHLSQRIRANNIVLHGVPDIAAHSRPADLTRYVSNKLDTATPHRGSPSQALSQSIRAVSHIGRPGSGKRAVLVEFSTHTAKHEAFKLSPHLRRSGLHLADELTPKQLKAQKGLEADFSALKLKGFRPFYRRGELKYRDQGVNRTCKRGEAIRVSAPVSPSRASPAPPGPPPRAPAPGRQGVRTSLPGHPSHGIGSSSSGRIGSSNGSRSGRRCRTLTRGRAPTSCGAWRHRHAGPFLGAWRWTFCPSPVPIGGCQPTPTKSAPCLISGMERVRPFRGHISSS